MAETVRALPRGGPDSLDWRVALDDVAKRVSWALYPMAVLELVFHRWILPATAPGPLDEPSHLFRLVDTYSPFFYFASGFLALALLALLLARLLFEREGAHPILRILLGLGASLFLPLDTVAHIANITPEAQAPRHFAALLPYLDVALGLLLLGLTLVSWSRPGRLRVKLAVAVLILPFVPLLASQQILWRPTVQRPLSVRLPQEASIWYLYGMGLAATSGLWLVWLLAPVPPKAQEQPTLGKRMFGRLASLLGLFCRPVPATAAVVATALAVLVNHWAFGLVQKLSDLSLGIAAWPPHSAMGLLSLLSLALMAALLTELSLAGKTWLRNALVLFLLNGYRLEDPLSFAYVALAFTHMAVAVRPGFSPTRESRVKQRQLWKQLLEDVRSALQMEGFRKIHTGSARVARGMVASFFGDWLGTEVEIRLASKKGWLESAEVRLGSIPSGEPDLILLCRPDDQEGEPIRTVKDSIRVADTVVTEAFQAAARRALPGRIAVWWGVGARYVLNLAALTAEPLGSDRWRQVLVLARMAAEYSGILPEKAG